MERKLAAILCADVHGYSRLMGDNEEATFRTLASHRKIIDQLIEQNHGRFVNSAGDSILAEFASVVNAVQCAIEIQAALKAENTALPEHRRMKFRIGINLGDIIVDGEQIYGDGVNVAARLESLADPGGICIASSVHEQVGNKLELNYQDIGEQKVKNIAKPVRVLRVLLEPLARVTAGGNRHLQLGRQYWRHGLLSVAGLIIVAVTIVLVQHISLKPPRSSASIPPRNKAALQGLRPPSIAVLPLSNLGNDPQQQSFSDGLAEDLITELGKVHDLSVVGRDSTVGYAGTHERAEQIGRELGVRYVLEGSTRKIGDQVRISARLVDTSNGFQLWAEHYDQLLSNLFKAQDEIGGKIQFAIRVKLSPDEQRRFKEFPTNNLEAYELYLRAKPLILSGTMAGIQEGRRLCERAVQLDPRYSAGYEGLAASYLYDYSLTGDPQALDRAFAAAQRSVALDDSSPYGHLVLGNVYQARKQLDRALSEARKSVALGPTCSVCLSGLADRLACAGHPTQALDLLKKAVRLDPSYGAGTRYQYEFDLAVQYQFQLGVVNSSLGNRAEAIDELKQVVVHLPADYLVSKWAHATLALLYAETDRQQEARTEASKWLELIKPVTIAQMRAGIRQTYPCNDLAQFMTNLDTLQRLTSFAAQNS
jgi:adenylate cyclase